MSGFCAAPAEHATFGRWFRRQGQMACDACETLSIVPQTQRAKKAKRTPSGDPKPRKEAHSGISYVDILHRTANAIRLTARQARYLALLAEGVPDECYLCGEGLTDENRTLDHVVPKSKGGTDDWENLKLCCQGCNVRKADSSLDDYLKMMATGVFPKRRIT